MATYYVSQSTGLNTNNGTSPTTPWQTLAFALGAASGTNPGIVGGDIIYVAPGTYNESVTLGFTSPSSTVQIIGDPLNVQGFPSVNGGIVQWSNSGVCLTATSKNNISLSNIYFERFTTNQNVAVITTTCYGWSITKCIIVSGVNGTSVSPTPLNWTISKCVICQANNQHGISFSTGSGTTYNINVNINDCLIFTTTGGGSVANIYVSGVGNGGTVSNCTFMHPNNNVQLATANTTNKMMVQNSLFLGSSAFFINPTGQLDAQYNRYVVGLGFNGVSGTGSTTGGLTGLDFGNARLFGYGLNDFFGSNAGAANIGFGTATNAPSTDLYGVTWLTVPDAGAVQRSSLSNFQPPTAPYVAGERNASTITIAPGSTSQSIELYLGVTGLTASTGSLAARYNRTRTASVSIPLVARTIAQAWTAGGFAEVDATNMPGVYRLDLPDAALAVGADDVTIVVRGASGTNGAVMTVKLSSGGLTSAQTAAAVWNALTDDYTTHGTYGWNVLRADAPSKEGLVTLHQSGGISRVDADVHAIANDTDAATELKGALLHNGTDYISADLLTPVSAATSVHIGPYQLLADGLGADQPLDVNVGTATSIDVQVTDANGTGIDITGATTSAKVYSSAGTLVATYSGTATYADNGRLSFGLTTTVTNTSGTYTITVTRTTGATDTQVFGPLKLYVRPV
jgi:hypothetical protein